VGADVKYREQIRERGGLKRDEAIFVLAEENDGGFGVDSQLGGREGTEAALLTTDDAKEGFRSFLEHQTPEFTGE
jgi:hypothetical protein